MKRLALVALVWIAFCTAGCRVTRDIVDLTPPSDQPPLQDLERHLQYTDPDAGRPNYVRTEPNS